MRVPDYLTQNKNRIFSLPQQNLGRWSSIYDLEEYTAFPVMQKLLKKFPEKLIHRSDIVDLFKHEKKYLGFIAAIVWGGILAGRPGRGQDKRTHFLKVLSFPEKIIEVAIKDTESCFINNDLATPFKNMMNKGKYKIPGVGYAYFTKIFFFLGQANDAIKFKPLILDKWTSNGFFALLSQTYPEKVYGLFSKIGEGNPGEVRLRSGETLAKVYSLYVDLMNKWSKNIKVTPDKLEEFIFGFHLRRGSQENNPRRELWQIVDANRNLLNK